MADETYRQWTDIFNPDSGSYYQGNWEEGSKMLFLGPSHDGKVSGMVSRIAANRPYEFLSIEHLGEVLDGVEDTTSERAKSWTAAHENYSFSEEDGVTTLQIDVDTNDEFKAMFEDAWPKALATLKELVETTPRG